MKIKNKMRNTLILITITFASLEIPNGRRMGSKTNSTHDWWRRGATIGGVIGHQSNKQKKPSLVLFLE